MRDAGGRAVTGAAVPGYTVATPVVTALYVPGDRPDRFEKAVRSRAQLVILDLEDAVADARKPRARRAVADWLDARAGDGPLVQVRVNRSPHDDLEALAAVRAPFGLRMPKVESAADLAVLGTDLTSLGVGISRSVTAIIETARGLQNLEEIAAHPAVTTLALGESDLGSDVGSTAQAVLDHARLRLLFAARAAGLPAPMMSVYPSIRDLEGLRTDTAHGRELGLVGRAAIHPSQVPVIADVFRPTPAEIAWAAEVLEATEHGGVSTLAGGEMVDGAMRGKAARILSLAKALGA